jgi:hypothetical protein
LLRAGYLRFDVGLMTGYDGRLGCAVSSCAAARDASAIVTLPVRLRQMLSALVTQYSPNTQGVSYHRLLSCNNYEVRQIGL